MNYTIGNAKTSIGAGLIKDLEMPYISIEKIQEGSFNIGDSVRGKEISVSDKTTIFIKNLEGLAVLEKAIKHVKKQLKQQNKKL
jgi:hypothetical protein